ncbi:putative malate dehydrogenase 1B [Gastrophryne carolinensis]
MAKFVLAGRADCPYYAKAEVLADYLQKNLPHFRIHKITQDPNNWEQWLAELCLKNGWKHKQSPIIWRELLDRGGKGLLLGGFNEFMEHTQEYYNVSSAMLSTLMKAIAAENMEAHMNLKIEEDELKRQFNPLHVWITSASMPACYYLIPILACGEVFGMKQEIWLHLLDNGQCTDTLQGLKMEAEDLAFPCLREVTLHTLADDAFIQADFVVILDDILAKEDQSPEGYIKMVTDQFMQYGNLIDKNANKEVKVVVAGSTFVNLKALVIMKNAPSVNHRNIVALPTQLELEAKAQIATKMAVNSPVVKDVIIWGNISGINHLDLHKAKIYKFDSSIYGPSSFSRPLLTMIFDRKWLKNDLVKEWRHRRHHRSGLSAAHSISSVLARWQQNSRHDEEIVSLGVLSEGNFDIPNNIVYSMPVQFKDGDWKVYTQVTVHEDVREILQEAASELIKETHIAFGMPQEEKATSQEQTGKEDTKENGISEPLAELEAGLEVSLNTGQNTPVTLESHEHAS